MAARAGVPGIREWLAAAPFPWPSARELEAGADVVACYCLTGLHVGKTKHDKSYLKLQLSDAHGTLEGRVWDGADALAEQLREGMYVGVRGRLEIFNNLRQVKVESISAVRVDLGELPLFLPRSQRDPAEMNAELAEWVGSITDLPLRALVERLVGEDSPYGEGFRLAPAAKMNHHAYLGGLLEHTLSVVAACDFLAGHYGPALDRDLLVAGALLHDIGKVAEISAQPGFPYTDEGKLLGHMLLGLRMVDEAASGLEGLPPARLDLVRHLIAAHQGRYEWQSPREPRTLEALLLHHVDDMDAKMTPALALVAATDGGWTGWSRSLGKEFFRHLEPGAARRDEDSYEAAPPTEAVAAEDRRPDTPRDGPPAEPPRPDTPPLGEAPSATPGSATPPREEPSNDAAADTLDLFGK
ncbi:MAG: HD domain-containing protein [Gemmatimonadota bacterium]